MPYKIYLAAAFSVPEIDGEDKEGAIDLLKVDLLPRVGVAHNQPNARWRSDGASILSLAACLSLAPF